MSRLSQDADVALSFRDISLDVHGRALPAVCATLDKAKAHFTGRGVDLRSVLERSLVADMRPLHYQLRCVVHHSLGALEALRSGRFAPPAPAPRRGWDEMRDDIAEAADALGAVTDAEIEALATREVLFSAGDRRRVFTAQEFFLSFSLPNLFFHATTAYDILRAHGAPLEKRDYLGRVPGRAV